jgi:hypothetical protein
VYTAAEHLPSPFSNLFFGVKWLYDCGFRGFYISYKGSVLMYHRKHSKFASAASAADLKLATKKEAHWHVTAKFSGLGAAHRLNIK